MKFRIISAGGCRSYFLGCERTRCAVVIDPHMDQAGEIAAFARRENMRVTDIIDTHTHADHVTGSLELARQVNAEITMHETARASFATRRISGGEKLGVGDLLIEVIHTPGHTLDSVCLLVNGRLFTGDTLMIGTVGRTDLPTGSSEAMYDSLFGKILTLPDEMLVYPGHNYDRRYHTTIDAERQHNPYLSVSSKGEFVQKMAGRVMALPENYKSAISYNVFGPVRTDVA